MLGDDLPAFLSQYKELIGFSKCEYGDYTMCYLPDGERIQINNWFSTNSTTSAQTLYYYFNSSNFIAGGATGVFIRLDTGYTYFSAQSGLSDSEHERLCEVAKGIALFSEVCGIRMY